MRVQLRQRWIESSSPKVLKQLLPGPLVGTSFNGGRHSDSNDADNNVEMSIEKSFLSLTTLLTPHQRRALSLNKCACMGEFGLHHQPVLYLDKTCGETDNGYTENRLCNQFHISMCNFTITSFLDVGS